MGEIWSLSCCSMLYQLKPFLLLLLEQSDNNEVKVVQPRNNKCMN